MSLSEKIFKNHCPTQVIPEPICKGHEMLHKKNVKEFIKELKEDGLPTSGCECCEKWQKNIDEKAGEDLI